MSTDEYTPDDAAVRDYYVEGRRWICAFSETRFALEFDRWLADHDAEIGFVAWGEGWHGRKSAEVRAETYRISYQKYLMETPGNFASVRDAVEDAFRAGWEAHE